jgi:hypothetical protein
MVLPTNISPVVRTQSLQDLSSASAVHVSATPVEPATASAPSSPTPRQPDFNRQAYWQRTMAKPPTPMQTLDAWRDSAPPAKRAAYEYFANEVKAHTERGEPCLAIGHCDVDTLPPSHALSHFKQLRFTSFPHVVEFPRDFASADVHLLAVEDFPSLERIPKVSPNSRQIDLVRCPKLSMLLENPAVDAPQGLIGLKLDACPAVPWPIFYVSPQLRVLAFHNMPQLTNVIGPSVNAGLTLLRILSCPNVTKLPDLAQCRQLGHVITDSPITSCPENMGEWSSGCSLEINSSHLPQDARNHLIHSMAQPEWSGPHIGFGMDES